MLKKIRSRNIRHKLKSLLLSCLTIVILSSILWTNLVQGGYAAELSANQQHILSRFSFGITSFEREQVQKNGLEAYLQSQLKPQSVQESAEINAYINRPSLANHQSKKLLRENVRQSKKLRNSQLSAKEHSMARQRIKQNNSTLRKQLIEAHLARAIYSRRQLQEVMVDFWFNHFNVNSKKGQVKFFVHDYENQIRDRALGNFYDLLLATAKHPAMLVYLDNRMNIAPDSPVGKKTDKGLNENYAREVMELHTLGVDGGYSQEDIISLAKIFTGWSIDVREKYTKADENGFSFHDNRHDPANKVFLGHQIAGGGIEEGEFALRILANHPATARLISYKLAQYFVADKPPESLVDRLAINFINSNGNITLVLDTLIHSPEFNDPQYYGQKFKNPYQYLVSIVRLAEIKQPELLRLRGMLSQLSMPVLECTTPNGYANTQSAWLNSQAMLQRTGLATAIANGVLNRSSPAKLAKLEQNVGEISPSTKQVVDKSPSRLRAALVMGSPQAMYR